MMERARIPIARPSLGPEEIEAAARVLRSGWVMQGPEVAAFEREFAAFVGAPFACAVSSGTTALHLALLAAGLRPGDEVVTVSYSFIATANAVRHGGAVPVFADIDAKTFNLDPGRAEAAVTPKTRAILAVHQFGMPCDLEALGALARKHRLRLIEDAACAVGSEVNEGGSWRKIGKPHGDIACFSFHPRKVLTTGEGGMLTTADPAWDARFRALRDHGKMLSPAGAVFAEVGYNYRMTDIQAAVGREQLRKLPDLLRERRRLAARYAARLASIPGVHPPAEPPRAHSNWQSYAVRLAGTIDPERVRQDLNRAGITVLPGIRCIHQEPAYRDIPLHQPLPNSEQAQNGSLLLPLYPGLSDAEQDFIVEKLAEAFGIRE